MDRGVLVSASVGNVAEYIIIYVYAYRIVILLTVLLVRVFRGQKWSSRSNTSSSKQLCMMLDWYLIFHFWSGLQPENQYDRQKSRWPPHGYKIHCCFLYLKQNSNSFRHARGCLICFAMNLSLSWYLTILYCYTWLQV